MTAIAQKPHRSTAGADGMIAFQQQLRALNEIIMVAINAAQAIASRQSAAVSELNLQMAALVSHSTTPAAPQDGVAAALAFAKQAFDANIVHRIAITEIAAKMETDALAILSRSVSAGLDGFGGAMQKISGAERQAFADDQ
jgi:hypothetical protein